VNELAPVFLRVTVSVVVTLPGKVTVAVRGDSESSATIQLTVSIPVMLSLPVIDALKVLKPVVVGVTLPAPVTGVGNIGLVQLPSDVAVKPLCVAPLSVITCEPV
jgi:hypothetical protein